MNLKRLNFLKSCVLVYIAELGVLVRNFWGVFVEHDTGMSGKAAITVVPLWCAIKVMYWKPLAMQASIYMSTASNLPAGTAK